MSEKTKNKQNKQKQTKTKLTKEEKLQLKQLVAKKKKKGLKKQMSAQESIPYQRMYKDGICRSGNNFFSKTIMFEDINYQLAENEDKGLIFESWCDFLNYFDPTITFQFSFLNISGDEKTFEQSIVISSKDDDFQGIREEYSTMLKNQLAKGNNGIIKQKYLTFGVEGTSYKKVKSRLEHIEVNIYNNFKKIGVNMYSLEGKERLKLMADMLQMQDVYFRFEWEWLARFGLNTKDFIAPPSFKFNAKNFKTGDNIGSVSCLNILAPEISDRILADFLEIESNQNVALHIKPVDHTKATKMVKAKLTDLEKTKIDEQKKAVRSGYDMDVLPSDLGAYVNELTKLSKDLQSRSERLFCFSFIIVNSEKTKEKLDNIVNQCLALAQKHTCQLFCLDYQQEQGFMSALPLATNLIEIERAMTTSATAGFVPFTTCELFQGGKALYYGLNALSNNMLMADRKNLKNPNGLILGTPGSGKSFSAKREMINVFLITNDDIAILDPEGEYQNVVEQMKGQVIKISPVSTQFINPMDINIDDGEGENPLVLKSDFILSLFELMMGKVEPDEKSIIDKCLQLCYKDYIADPLNTPMPILQDLYEQIVSYGGKQAKHVADCMTIYVTGSLNVFNNRTNVDITNRVVCFETRELGNALKEFGMLVVQDQIWNRVSRNRSAKKSTRYYIDEMHLLLGREQTANYTVEIWKRFRKWGGIPTGLTQNVKDFLGSPQIANIFENSDFIYLLNQAGGDREILAKQLNISPHQLSYVTNSNAGEGLIIFGNVIIPFIDRFPKDTMLYQMMTTKLDEVETLKEVVDVTEYTEIKE